MQYGWARRLLACERGNALLGAAATLPLLIGSSALAFDTVQLAIWTHQLQHAADAGALAGAEALAQGRPVRSAVDGAIHADRRLHVVAPPRIESSAGGQPRIRVVIASQKPLPVYGALLEGPPMRVAEATAVVGTSLVTSR